MSQIKTSLLRHAQRLDTPGFKTRIAKVSLSLCVCVYVAGRRIKQRGIWHPRTREHQHGQLRDLQEQHRQRRQKCLRCSTSRAHIKKNKKTMAQSENNPAASITAVCSPYDKRFLKLPSVSASTSLTGTTPTSTASLPCASIGKVLR